MFVDIGDHGGKGGPAKFMALKEGIITYPEDDLEGADFWRAVDALRDEGYEIPIFVPEAGSVNRDGEEYEKTPLRALRNAAVALDLIPPEAFVTKEGDDGGTYLDFPGKRTRGEALEKLKELGINHGWDDPEVDDNVVSDDSDGESEDNPTYEVLPPEDGDVKLHLIPVDGLSAGVEITQNGCVEYSEIRDRGFWNSQTIRSRIAGDVAEELTGVDQGAVKDGVKSALNQISVAEREDPETFEDELRSEHEQELRDRTQRVVCHPTGDSAEWVVTLDPPDDSPVAEARELSFDEGDFNDDNAGTFKNAHLAKFYSKVEIDHREWDNLTDYWLENQITADYEPDLELEAVVDKFTDWVANLRVWADEGGFSWSSLHGYLAEDYHDGEDAVLVPGQKVVDWRHRENVDPQTNLSKELRERGIMLTSTSREKIGDGPNSRKTVWPIAADATPHTAETALRLDGEDEDEGEDEDDDRPEGLR